MRWVIVGPYAPERGDGPAAAVAAATERLRAGDEVLTVSPRPSAAHQHQPLVGPLAWRRLASVLRPGDGLWVRVEPGVLFARSTGRAAALVDRGWFRWSVRRCATVVLDVGDAGVFPGGRAGSLTFGAVDRLVVHRLADRDALLAAGAPPAKVVGPTDAARPAVASLEHSEAPVAPPLGAVDLPVGVGREAVEQLIRDRASVAPVRPVDRS